MYTIVQIDRWVSLTRPRGVGADQVPWYIGIFRWSLSTGRGIGIETCEVDNMFPIDNLCFGSDTNTNCAVVYSLYLDA